MPNFREHLLYSSVILNAILVTGILVLLWDNQDLSKHAIILATIIPVLYYIGAIAPDIDVPKPNQVVEKLMYALPVAFGASFWYRTQSYIVGGMAIIAMSGCVYFTITNVTHRGWVHSMSFMILLSLVISVIIYNVSIDMFISALLGAIFGIGFFSHLLLDEIKNLKTGGRRAIKLW